MVTEIGMIRSRLDRMMLRIWEVSVPPGKRPLQNHTHIQFEIMRVKRGEGEYTTKNARYPIHAGDMFVFGSEVMHCITDVGPEGLDIVNLHFAPEYIWESTSEIMDVEHGNFCFAQSDAFSCRIPAESASGLAELFRKTENEIRERETEFALLARAYLFQMIVLLIRDFGYADCTTPAAREHIKCIRRALVYIDLHLEDKLCLEDIAAAAGMSPAYFSTVFRRVSRIGLWEYITSKRIDKAVRLMTAEDRSETMLEIAARCGYNSTANFNKAFKRRMGMTPSEYLHTDRMPL